MAEVITMPRLSDTMTEGKVAKWNLKLNDPVNEGDVLAEIETDKAVQDFESEVKGVLLYIGVEEGQAAPVDSVLAIIGEPGEDISSLTGKGNSNPSSEKAESGSASGISEDFRTENENTAVETSEPVEKESGSSNEQASSASADVPEGVEVITVPRLSDTMTEGKVAKWHKNVGDEVKEGDILAEIETDKAVQDFESEFNGTLLHQGVAEGNGGPVDSVLAIIGPAGTDVSAILSGGKAKAENKPTAEKPQEIKEETVKAEVAQNNDGSRLAISPLARKMAAEKGIDLKQLQGSGENGRIVKKDVESFTPSKQPSTSGQEKAAPQASPAARVAAEFVSGETTETPNSQVRNIIAKRLSESKFSAPHYYLMVEINMDKAIEARKEINSLPDTKISFNDMIIKATAMALRKHPQVNSSWAGDKIIHHGDINVGVAVAIPDGLVVPVLRNTDHMNYLQISSAVKDMASRAKSKGLKANEMEGSTFSVSNLGMFGIETFTSIINQPNSAILSVGAIIEKPVVKDGQIVVGNTMKLSLACDHRVVDGATGAQFLQTLRTYLEQPLTLLL
ncbi:pyruvate dehydrogenase complex dihydrolipoamide acetyltransferase [Chryseobacterium sp.]|uniref:pyruvate dehydrogenase complex dihydrolipoamide acetyltransferase n=1 Tax=Chryseobacterium sp. TaxID=1871047 RepID=UPI0012A8ECB7|nr:pyruvate dehydrogenase complex dihydrolipoamide acetyltransferase [Chryseobacterium sp.]QFG53247.1 pyruvate dehydrogenase [Chryseobacterium sp.]